MKTMTGCRSPVLASRGSIGDADADVAVVGASVAGATAALLLARAGLRVGVIEASAESRDKVCGEGIQPLGRELLETLVGPLDEHGTPFHGFEFEMASGGRLNWRFPGAVHGLSIERRVLGDVLRDRLRASPGIALHAGVPVTGIERSGSQWMLRTSAGPMRAPLLVCADGVHSRARAWLGLESGAALGRWGARRRYSWPSHSAPRVRVIFLGHGEIYITPLPLRRVSVAILGEEPWIRELRDGAMFDRVMTSAGVLPVAAVPCGEPAILPHRGRRATAVATRGAFLAGDAACFVDPVTGAGMTLAALSGVLAAAAVLRKIRANNDDGGAAEAWYERQIAQARAPFDRLARVLCAIGQSRALRFLAPRLLGCAPAAIGWLARPIMEPAPATRDAISLMLTAYARDGTSRFRSLRGLPHAAEA